MIAVPLLLQWNANSYRYVLSIITVLLIWSDRLNIKTSISEIKIGDNVKILK